MELIHETPTSADHYIRTMEAFHTLEHVADHAVAIAVRVRMIYLPQGDALSSDKGLTIAGLEGDSPQV